VTSEKRRSGETEGLEPEISLSRTIAGSDETVTSEKRRSGETEGLEPERVKGTGESGTRIRDSELMRPRVAELGRRR
jgi:hypothetical protein